jgi:hypothetical protein
VTDWSEGIHRIGGRYPLESLARLTQNGWWAYSGVRSQVCVDGVQPVTGDCADLRPREPERKVDYDPPPLSCAVPWTTGR